MKIIFTLLVVAGAAAAQIPQVRDINVYGQGKLPVERILTAAKVQAGQPLPASKGDIEDRVMQIPGVVEARVEAVCCEGPSIVLFVGIEQREGPHVALRSEPNGDKSLPAGIVEGYRDYLKAVEGGGRGEKGGPYRLLLPGVGPAELEQELMPLTDQHLAEIRDVLRNSAETPERAIAATVISYSSKPPTVIDDLQYALQDPDEAVRGNAIRSLNRLALLGARNWKLGIRISPTWLIELLNSLTLSDRLLATSALLTLTDSRDRNILDQIRDRGLPALVEMARWDTLNYALPPFLLVGRIAGLKDEEIESRWSKGERQPVIDQALNSVPKRR